MKKLALGLSIAALAIGGGAVSAQAGKHHGADADGNGAVTRTEAAAKASAMFARMDVNKDGKIDAADREARMTAMFDRLDADHNGQISRAEFMSGHQGMHGMGGSGAGMMGGMGHGGQGAMHGGAMHGRGMMGMMMGMADADKDGAVTQAEFTSAATRHFDEVDTNHDGSISREERRAAHQAMRAKWQAQKQEHAH